MLKLLRFSLAVGFSLFLYSLGYTLMTKQYWIGVGLFIAYGMVVGLDSMINGSF